MCAFPIIIRSVRNLFKIWMQEAAAGRKNLLAAFFYNGYRKKLITSQRKKGIYKRRIFCYDRLRYKTYQISIERKITK